MKHSEIRQTIVDTASRLFYANGYNRTGINEIIKEAGIAKATLYSHFPAKEDICIAYLQSKNTQFLDEISQYCQSKPEGQQRVLAIFDFLQVFFQQREFNGCWCINTVSEVPLETERIHREIRGQKQGLIDFISALISENIEGVTEARSAALGKQLYLLYEGAVAESHLHQSDWPIKEMKEVAAVLVA